MPVEFQIKKTITSEDIKTTMPYPIASVYADLDNLASSPQTKRTALYFTGYQLMRTIALTLMGQYFTQDLPDDESKREKCSSLNKAIAGVGCPHYGDWVGLVNSFNNNGASVGLDFFPEFGEAMKQMKNNRVDLPENEKAYHLDQGKKWQNVTWLQALWGLRNGEAHSGMGRDDVCLEAVTYFRPFIDSLLDAFSFLSRYELLVLRSTLDEDEPFVQLLRGAQIPEPQVQEIDAVLKVAFKESPVVMRSPEGRVQSLFPFFHGHIEGEPMHYYDGHYLRDIPTDPKMNRRMIYYLGCGQRFPLEDDEAFKFVQSPASPDAAERLRQFLDARSISWQMKREDVTPWNLRDTVNDYARRTLKGLIGKKYLPECYLDRPNLSEWLWNLATIEKTHHRVMLFTGRAGSGKSALLSDLTRRLLEEEKDHLVFFVQGNNLTAEITGGNQLLANLLHKIGLKETEFPTFANFFNHYAIKHKEDKEMSGRRFVIVIDAVNEAQNSMQVMREALEMVAAAREHNWLRIILSAREEFMSVWGGRRGELEANPFYPVRDLFVLPPEDPERPLNPEDPPAWFVPTFTEEEAAEVYSRYQTAKADGGNTRACLTLWNEIPPATRRELLTLPLHLYLWMLTFDGRQAPAINNAVELFQEYITDLRGQFPKLWASMSVILDYMMTHGRMELADADAHQIEDAWRARMSEYEQRLRFSPLETACVSGVMQKQITEEGGGYRIPHQRLREVLLYLRMKERNPRLESETIKEWLSLPKTEELEGALALIANDLWIKERTAHLSDFPTTDMGAESLARMLARRLALRDETDVLAKRIQKMLDTTPTEEAAILRMSELLLSNMSDKVEGLPVTSGKRIIWEQTLAWLESKPEHFQHNIELGRNTGITYSKLADIYRDTGESEKALQFYEKSLEIRVKLYQVEPQRTRLGRGIGFTYERLGDIYRDAGESEKALQFYEKYSEIFEQLHKEKPHRTDLASGRGFSYERLGIISRAMGNNENALQFYKRYSNIFEQLYETEPERVDLGRFVSFSYEKLGEIYWVTGKSKKALQFYKKCLEIREKLYRAKPQRADLARELCYSYVKLGETCKITDSNEEALKYYEKTLIIREKLYQDEPQRTDLAREVGCSYENLGDIYRNIDNNKMALEYYEKTLKIREKLYQDEPQRTDLARELKFCTDRIKEIKQKIDSKEVKK